jgi:hypothetical protein
MRMVFYPAVAGWILTGIWIANLMIRLELVRFRKEESQSPVFQNNTK